MLGYAEIVAPALTKHCQTDSKKKPDLLHSFYDIPVSQACVWSFLISCATMNSQKLITKVDQKELKLNNIA